MDRLHGGGPPPGKANLIQAGGGGEIEGKLEIKRAKPRHKLPFLRVRGL